jgi:hypothetical protein
MKPLIHCKASVHKFGGKIDDYMKIHEFFDQTKAHVSDIRHRAVLHNAFGIYLCQQVFGYYFTNSDGKDVSVRDVGEQHVLEDLGHIPSLDKCFANMPMEAWFAGRIISKRVLVLSDPSTLVID